MPDNILELHIRNLFCFFSKNATEILTTIENAGSNYSIDDFYKYLQGYFHDLPKFRDILQNVSLIASEAPYNSIKVFYDLLPHIDISSENQTNLNELNTFIAFIKQPEKINWANQHSRYGIALYVEVLTAIFCLEIVEFADFSDPGRQKEAKQIFDFIEWTISVNINDPQYNKFRTIPSSIYSNVLFYLSKVEPSIFTHSVEYLKSNSSLKDYSDDKQSIYFNLYSKIFFRDVHDIDKNVRKQLVQLAKNANKVLKTNYDLHCALYNFLTNFVGNLCMSDDSFRTPKGLIGDIMSPAKSILSSGYFGPAFECLALLITFSSKSHEISKHLQYFTKFVKSQEHAYSILRSFIIILIGHNYRAIYRNGEQYIADFHVIKDLHIVNEIFDSVYENSFVFIIHQELMTEFIAQIAAADIQSFMLERLPNKIFNDKSSFLNDNGIAVFGAARILVQSAYHFPIDENKRLKLINLFQGKALYLSSSYDPTSVDNWTKTVTNLKVFLVKSFVESIILHHDNTNELYFYNQSESVPIPYKRPNTKTVITAVINRWKKLFSNELSSAQIFKDADHQVRPFNPDMIDHLILPSAICIIPLAKPSLICIEDLSANLYSESASVGAASIRALQAIIHLSEEREIIEEVLDYIEHFVSKRTISSNEVLFRTIYAIELILDSVCYKKFPISEKYRLMCNKAACIGFCSSSYDIRLHGYNIGKFIEGSLSNPSVTEIFENCADEIAFTTKIDILSSISYKNYSTSDTSSFNAFDLMQSKFSYLYQFELATFASKLREKLQKNDLLVTRKTILESLKAFFSSPTSLKKFIDPLFVLNLIIFLFNTCNKSDFKSLQKLSEIFVEMMDSKEEKEDNCGDFPYFAFFAEIDPEVCLMFISEYNNLDSHFLLPLMFSLRRRIDNKSIRLNNEVVFLILSFLEKILKLFAHYDFSYTKLTFTAPKPSSALLEEQLLSFLQFSKTMLGFIRNNNQRDPASPFNRIPIFSKTAQNNKKKENSHIIDSIDLKDPNEPNEEEDANAFNFKINIDHDAWQIFLLNISSCKSHLGTSAQNTLTALMRIFPLSEKTYSQFIHNLNLFDMNSKVIGALLTQSILYMQYSYKYLLFEYIINESHTKSSYFKALSGLFREASSTDEVLKDIEMSMRNQPTEQEKSFYDITFKHSGSLLALSFYYILLSDGLERAAGFRVLQSISIGLAVTKKNVTAKMCHRIDEIRPHIINSNHSNTALESCASLSKVLASQFGFISEQFVFSIFSLIEKEKSLSLIALPWIKSVNISASNDHHTVLTETDSYFTMFTSNTFISCLLSLPSSKNVLQIIEKAIDEQIEGSFDIFEFIIIKIFSSKLHKKENAKRYATIIVYLYTIYPEKVLKILMKILSYDFWHYHEVQINKLDALFDISKLLSQLSSMATASSTATATTSSEKDENESSKKQNIPQPESMADFYPNPNSNTSFAAMNSYSSNNISMRNINDDEEDDEDVYKTTVMFVLSIFHYCINEKKEPFEPFIPTLILFTFVNIRNYPNMCFPILSALLPFDGSDDEELHKYILNLDLETREKLSIESLAWGLCCGDLDIALNGLAFFRFVELDLTDSIVDSVLKSLFVISTCLYERTHKIQTPAEKQWLYQVLDMKKEPDYKLTMLYVENLINILSFAKPREDVFNTVVSLLNLSGDETAVVLNAAINYITKMLTISNDFAYHISKSKKPADFRGLIPMIASCTFSEETPHYFFNLFRVLKSNKKNLRKLGYNVDESKYLYETIEAIMNVIDSEKDETFITVNNLSKIPVDDLNIILMLLTQIIGKIKGSNQPLLYDICAQILSTNVEDEYVAMLARAVKTDRNSDNFHSLNELLKAVNKHGFGIASQSVINGKQSFPKLCFDVDYYKMMEDDKEANEESAFNGTFPPMLPSDTGFLNCPIMSKVKTCVERVLAQPFSQWSDLMFKCCSIELAEKSLDNKHQLMFELIPKETFKKWAHEIAVYVDDDDDKVKLYNIQKPKLKVEEEEVKQQEENIDKLEFNKIDTVTTNLFLPSPEIIESVGANDILKGMDLPKVLIIDQLT